MRLRPFTLLAAGFGLLVFSGFSYGAAQQDPSGLLYEQLVQWQLPYQPIDVVQSVDGKFTFVLTSNNRVLIYEPNGQLKGSIPVDKGVKALATDARGETIFLVNGDNNTFTALSVDFVTDIDIAGSPYEGSVNAPVTIVVFTDFECPYCKKLEPLLKQVFESNKQNVKVVFKNMPLRFHQFADPAARAALAAFNQGKFWEFHDELFAAEELSDAFIANTAVKLGLDIAKFNQDMNSPAIRQKIAKDIQDAQLAAVTGTPTVFINGKRLKNRSPQGFQEMIDAELGLAKK